MISCQDQEVTEHHLTRHLLNNDLQMLLHVERFDTASKLVLIGLPTHTKAAERAVKEVTPSLQLCVIMPLSIIALRR